jgi:hypothetical protein
LHVVFDYPKEVVLEDGEEKVVQLSLTLEEMVPGIKEVNVSVQNRENGISWIGKVAHHF